MPVRERLAWLVWLASMVLVALATVLYGVNASVVGSSFDPVAPALGMIAPGVGAIVLARQPDNRFAWILSATAVLALGYFAEQYATYSLVTRSTALPAATWMAWMGTWLWAPATLWLRTVALLWFPTGRVISRRWGMVLTVTVLMIATTTALTAMAPGQLPGYPVENPFGAVAVPEGSAVVASWAVLAMTRSAFSGSW